MKACLLSCCLLLSPLCAVVAQSDAAAQLSVDSVLINTRDGTPIAAIVVRNAAHAARQPTALMYTIYSSDNDIGIARYAARWGYVSVIAYARGIKTGAVRVVPYEHDANDAYDVIDWISRQPWSDGQVGMYGGSYAGFTQWAVAPLGHPALKTIVPQVAAAPGIGEPMENNVFVTQLAYLWPLGVAEQQRVPETFFDDWWRSGRAYRDLDTVSGLENRIFNRWIAHSQFDAFWRGITTHGDAFKRVNIPVLTTTGYYDDAQLSALYYFREHYRNNPDAAHHLVIGPYDHFGGQVRPARNLRGYVIDSSAHVLMGDLALEWFDHIMRGKPRPALIRDKVNYQVMGADRWRHASSIEAMSDHSARLYLGSDSMNSFGARLLSPDKPDNRTRHRQVVDFSDRDTQLNVFEPRIISDLSPVDETLRFVSAPFDEQVELSGALGGELVITINKRDVDLSFALYEQMPDGRLFFLNRYLGRASYARDRSNRVLLRPGERTVVPLREMRITSRKLSKGSRLMLILSVNKHPFEQLNYGTGKDVSDESIVDAGTPLEILWHGESYVDVPLRRVSSNE